MKRIYNPRFVEEAQKRLIECDKMDDNLTGYFNGDEKRYATFQAALTKGD